MIQHKSFDIDFKASDDAGGFTAYVARFGNVDRTAEVIEPGAFKNLAAFVGDGWIGVNHDMKSLPVAMVESAVQDGHGLLVSARWHGTPDAQAARTIVNERIAAGKSVKCSIGYKVLDSSPDRLDGKSITRLKSLDLFEASIVNLPANPAASVLMAKSDGPKLLTVDDLRAWLDVETKAGRVLSRSNHSRLREWHGTLSAMVGQLGEMVEMHDPDRMLMPGDESNEAAPVSAGDGATSVEHQMAAGKSANELRAALLRARLSLLQPST